MVIVRYSNRFQKVFSKLKDRELKLKIIKQIKKIKINPEVGKPMKNVRKGTREVYTEPFRLFYAYMERENTVIFLDLYHKKHQ